jgi:hypothetical protein
MPTGPKGQKRPSRNLGDWSRSETTLCLGIAAIALASVVAVMLAPRLAERFL